MKPVTVHFQDQGQDFLQWDIKDGKVIDSRPFQADIWSGLEVLNGIIYVGDYLTVRRSSGSILQIKYPIIDITPMAGSVQIGPTDI